MKLLNSIWILLSVICICSLATLFCVAVAKMIAGTWLSWEMLAAKIVYVSMMITIIITVVLFYKDDRIPSKDKGVWLVCCIMMSAWVIPLLAYKILYMPPKKPKEKKDAQKN